MASRSTWIPVGTLVVGLAGGFVGGRLQAPEIAPHPPFGERDVAVEPIGDERFAVSSPASDLLLFEETDGPDGRRLFDVVPQGEERTVEAKPFGFSVFEIRPLRLCPPPPGPCIDCRRGQCTTLRPPTLATFEPSRRPEVECTCANYCSGTCPTRPPDCVCPGG